MQRGAIAPSLVELMLFHSAPFVVSTTTASQLAYCLGTEIERLSEGPQIMCTQLRVQVRSAVGIRSVLAEDRRLQAAFHAVELQQAGCGVISSGSAVAEPCVAPDQVPHPNLYSHESSLGRGRSDRRYTGGLRRSEGSTAATSAQGEVSLSEAVPEEELVRQVFVVRNVRYVVRSCACCDGS